MKWDDVFGSRPFARAGGILEDLLLDKQILQEQEVLRFVDHFEYNSMLTRFALVSER